MTSMAKLYRVTPPVIFFRDGTRVFGAVVPWPDMIRTVETIETIHGPHDIEEVVCNRCGNSCMEPHPPPDGKLVAQGMIGLVLQGGYLDVFPPDLQRWRIDLCEPCLGWLVSTFVHFPFESQRCTCECGQNPRINHDSTEKLLMHGETAGIPNWMLQRYALAMARGAERIQGIDERLREATLAAAKVLEEHDKQALEDSRATHRALNAIGCPGQGSALDRIQTLPAGPLEERLLAALQATHAIIEKIVYRYPGDPIESGEHEELVDKFEAVDAYLRSLESSKATS